MPTRLQGSASDTPSVVSCHLTCDKRRPARTAARRNCRQVQHWTFERRLAQRLTDHALGRGARLTQVQIERGGFWVLAQTQPGGRATERRLKQHGATRRCEVCKAAEAFQSGELTAPEALARAGWDRSNPVQRSLLLDIFGIPNPPEMHPAEAPEAAAAMEPAVVNAGQPSAEPQPEVPAPRAKPRLGWAWPGEPVTASPELDPVVDALIERWRSPKADVQPQPEPEPAAHSPPEPVVEAGL